MNLHVDTEPVIRLERRNMSGFYLHIIYLFMYIYIYLDHQTYDVLQYCICSNYCIKGSVVIRRFIIFLGQGTTSPDVMHSYELFCSTTSSLYE